MSQASHNTLARIDGGIKWWCGYMRPGKMAVTTATDYLITGYRWDAAPS